MPKQPEKIPKATIRAIFLKCGAIKVSRAATEKTVAIVENIIKEIGIKAVRHSRAAKRKWLMEKDIIKAVGFES